MLFRSLLHARRRLATVRLVGVYSNICSGQSNISLASQLGLHPLSYLDGQFVQYSYMSWDASNIS